MVTYEFFFAAFVKKKNYWHTNLVRLMSVECPLGETAAEIAKTSILREIRGFFERQAQEGPSRFEYHGSLLLISVFFFV